MKTIKQYFPVVLFVMLYKVVLTFESVDKIQKCNHLNETGTEHLISCITTICFSI